MAEMVPQDYYPEDAGNNGMSNALEAEKAVLALCMRNREALESSVIKALVSGDFLDPKHVVIYDAITSLYLDSKDVNRISVCDKLQTTGKIQAAGGDTYVYTVANYNCVMSAIDSYIDVVTQNSGSRKLQNTLTELTSLANSRKSSVNDIVDLGIEKLNLLKNKDESTGVEKLESILKRNLTELHKAAFEHGDNRIVKTGFTYLDNITGGFRPGTVNIIAARPGMGKTALVLNIATNVAGMYSKPVIIFSLEMSKTEIVNRILAAMSHTDFKAIQRASITREQEADLIDTMGRINSLPIYIDEKTDTNPMDIMSKCRELMSTVPNLALVIIDYIQIMKTPGNSYGSRQNEVADISRSLKLLAKELKIPVIALSQLNRGTETREEGEHIPGLADIKDSGAIEQDADTVIFIHRPAYYNKKKDQKDKTSKFEEAQLIVAKNRHGETDTAYVKWYGAKTLFIEPGKKDDPEDPMESAYTRTQSSDASSQDYNFDDVPPEQMYPEGRSSEPDYAEDQGTDEDYGANGNEDNAAFFGADTNEDFSGDFL